MEVELKFVLPDGAVLARLARVGDLAGYALGEAREQRCRDQFFDTADGRLLARGWYLRQRNAPDGRWLTLKGQDSLEGAVHRRQEWNVPLPEGNDPSHLPPGQLRDKLAELTDGEPLRRLVALRQVRLDRTVTRDGRTVGEMSLDRVRYQSGGASTEELEVEIELGQDGTAEDLDRLARCH